MIFKDAFEQKWGLITIGIITFVYIVLMIITRIKRTQRAKNSNDERYQLLMLKASRLGFYTILVWAAVYITLCLILNKPLMSDGLCLVIGVSAGTTATKIYRIIRDIWWDDNFDPDKYIWCNVLLGLYWAYRGFRSLTKGEMIRDGLLTYSFVSVLVAVTILSEPVALLIRNRLANRADGE